MRILLTPFAAGLVVLTASACSSEQAANPGVAGAGLTTAIVGMTHDSTGYSVKLQITNRDTGTITIAHHCPGAVEAFSNGGWAPVTIQGQCLNDAEVILPGVTVDAVIPGQPLKPNSDV